MNSAASVTADSAPRISADRVSVAELYRQMWHYATGARLWLALSSLMLIGSQLVKLSVPWLAAKAIDTLQTNPDGSGVAACAPWVGAIVAASSAAWALHGPGRVIERSVALRVRRALTDRLYERLSRAPLPWHGSHHSAELAHRLSQATGALSNFTQSQFIYLQTSVNLVGPLVALALLSTATGGMALVGLVAVALTIVAFDRTMMRLARTENDAERRHAAGLLDSLSNIGTVLSLRLQDTTRRLLARRLDDVVVPLKRSITLGEWKWCAVDLLTITLTWGLVTVYAWRSHAGGTLLLGGVFMVYQYAQQAGGVIGSLASNLQNFARMRTDFASAEPIWNAPQSRRVAVDVPVESSAAWRRIDLCDLSYAHPAVPGDTAPAGLHKASLRLHRGERIALVGPSGSGKSTLLRVIAGLCEPTHGHVEIDGVTPFGLRDLRGIATLIPQEPEVFEATVRENLGFDLPYGEPDLLSACRTGSFDSVLQSLPLGLDTPLAQGGSNLSGGQRQRLCLARGVLAARGSSVLLLDEPTSALDPLTEALVYDRLAADFPEACLVASVHRLSLLSRFDRVVLLVQGQIVDTGTAQELMQRQPLFREMAGAAEPVPSARESSAA